LCEFGANLQRDGGALLPFLLNSAGVGCTILLVDADNCVNGLGWRSNLRYHVVTMAINPSAVIHPTAIVDTGASIGSETRVWHWSHVCAGAVIGDRCSLGQNVFVGNWVRIGSNVKIQNNVSVYDNVVLEDDVFCGPSMVFTNVYNPRSAVSRKDEYRDTIIERGATLGANSTIVCGSRVGRYAFVGAGAVINRDVKPFALMVGVPARQVGWMSAYGERVSLPLQGQGFWTCPHTGDHYELHGDQLSFTPAVPG
jgi:UDP-2-acetamido-3-amino-2,3-dideoxy-glucuronate N-acetyltransferase